jgi:hypothetical protein
MADVPGPRLRLAGRSVVAFHACGLTGLAAAVALSQALVLHAGGSALVMTAAIVLACAVFLALAMAQKLLTGAERLVYYHHEIGVLLAVAALVAVLGREPLAYLDATTLGIGAFLACGRCGCTLAGCCHGRPARRGLRYGPEHVRSGFPAALAGVALVPVQLLEAVWAAALVGAGTTIVLSGAAPGTALTLYLLLYAVVRFGLEFLRGDAERPALYGMSAAQWTSLAVLAAVAVLEHAGVLPGARWHDVALPALLLATLSVLLVRRRRHGGAALLGARHAQELAAVLAALRAPTADGAVSVRTTSLGVRVSAGASAGRRHFALSREHTALSDASAAGLARLVARLDGLPEPVALRRGPSGAVHVTSASRDDEGPAGAGPSLARPLGERTT